MNIIDETWGKKKSINVLVKPRPLLQLINMCIENHFHPFSLTRLWKKPSTKTINWGEKGPHRNAQRFQSDTDYPQSICYEQREREKSALTQPSCKKENLVSQTISKSGMNDQLERDESIYCVCVFLLFFFSFRFPSRSVRGFFWLLWGIIICSNNTHKRK